MEYFNVINDEYLQILKSKIRHDLIMIELLDWNEIPFADITNEINNNGSISYNNQSGAQRGCNLSIVDKDGNFTSQFAVNGKFKVWYGVSNGTNTYYHSQGVFSPKDLSISNFGFDVTAVDKFGFLSGDLKTGSFTADLELQASQGTIVGNLIEDLLSWDTGNGKTLDPIEPNIDDEMYSTSLDTDITISAGGHIGDVLTQLASWYGCNVYYDNNGILRFEKIMDYGFPSRILQKPIVFNFDELGLTYDDLKIKESYDNCNTVTVATDNTDGDIISVTLQNTNPLSPYSVDKVGTRLYDGEGVSNGVYSIPIRATTTESERACRDMAEYLLLKQAMQSSTIDFAAPVIPHLQVGDAITVKDKDYIVQSLTIPLTASTMQISATSIDVLPYEEV